MRYKTIIEVFCDEIDAENALNMAGEYLRGKVDSGVYMKCRTISSNVHILKKIFVTGSVVLFFILV